mmetsp:Transcript_45426/g.126075  ORF Transcript_45426/g.126075 Transcript_45426/m.126075 type:complete len:95 (+) Transcript_45426:126-410(+)
MHADCWNLALAKHEGSALGAASPVDFAWELGKLSLPKHEVSVLAVAADCAWLLAGAFGTDQASNALPMASFDASPAVCLALEEEHDAGAARQAA